MLMLATNVIGMPVSSIRLAGKIGEVTGLLVNPNTLKLAAFWVQIGAKKEDELLLFEDMREFNIKGIIVDDMHNISAPDELTRLKEVLKINYQIPGKKVVGSKGKMGVANNFSFDPKTAEIMTIIGKPSLTKRFGASEFTAHRTQIEEINDSLIRINNGPKTAPLKPNLGKLAGKETGYSSSAAEISE